MYGASKRCKKWGREHNWMKVTKFFTTQLARGLRICRAMLRDTKDIGLIPGSGRSPGGGNGNPPQYSCLGNPTDRRAWQATVHGVAKNQTQLSILACNQICEMQDTSKNFVGTVWKDSDRLQATKGQWLRLIYFCILYNPQHSISCT